MPSSRVIRFGPFEVNLDSGEVCRNGSKLHLQAQPFELLTLLLQRPGEVVTREEIRAKLWPADTFVDFDHSLGTAINKVRGALHDSAERPQFVETLPKRGYRFIGTIEPPTSTIPGSTADLPAAPASPSPARTNTTTVSAAIPNKTSSHFAHRPLAASLILAVFLLASALYFWRDSLFRKASAAPIQSIAVLPLANLSANPDEQFFTDGMTDELITDLAKISSLRIISRTSVIHYRDAHKSIPEIARELGVDAIVEGTVLRADGKVRITAQLINGAADRHLWAEEYQRDARDILTLQSEVARDIAGSIHARLTSLEQADLARLRPVDPAIQDLYWKGVHFANQVTVPDFMRAQQYFDQMVKADPKNARGWAGVAMVAHYLAFGGDYEAFPRAKAAALKSIELDGSLAEAHAELAMLTFIYDWNIAEAEREFQHAITLNANYSRTYVYYAVMLAHIGRNQEAIEEINRARSLDPLSILRCRSLAMSTCAHGATTRLSRCFASRSI
jgi:TolB-like protein/DNA-binding winged helix-turn-helix (wHTH) protein